MKSYKKTSTTKLVARFDSELKTILLSDLDNVRGNKKQLFHSNNQARVQARLSVA